VVAAAAPAWVLLGISAMAVPGAGLLIATVAAVEVPPPGVPFTAVNERLPTAAMSVAVKVTSTCVALSKTVARPLPFTSTTVVGTNPVPVTANVAGAPPVVNTVGVNNEITGAGFVTLRFIAVPDPLLAVPFNAMIGSCPPLANCSAVNVAVTSVALT
jgi:hypothetical protein